MIGDTAIGGVFDVIYDSEVPRTFTARALEIVSGGQFVTASGAGGADSVGSTADLFATGSVLVAPISGTVGAWYANGIALANAGVGSLVTVATRGTYITNAANTIIGGAKVTVVSGTVQGVGIAPNNSDFSGTEVGRAITGGTSGTTAPILVYFAF